MASKKLRIGIIGAGMIANSAHLPAIANLENEGLAEVVGVADIRKTAAEETAHRHNIGHWYVDPQKMLDELSPDLVAICTPNVPHKEWSIAALKSGAHVMCEKPLTLTYRDAKEMFAVANECGRILYPCQSRRWSPDMVFARDAIIQGDIGKPYFADINFVRRYGIPTWGMFHMKEYNGGGAFCDLGVHFIDALLWMTGSPRVEAVSGKAFDRLAKQGNEILLSIKESGAYTGTFTPRPYDHREFDVEECAVGTMRLEGDFCVNFKFTWALNLPTSKSFVVCGENGGIDSEKSMLYKNTGHYQSEIGLKFFDNRPYAGVPFDGHRYMYPHVLNVIAGREERVVKPEETLNVVAAIECFYRSAGENREIASRELEGYEL